MRLFIAEKPSLARAIADVLPKPHRKGDGFIECGNGQVVTWCIGHLLEQAELAGLKIEPFVRNVILSVQMQPRPKEEWAELLRQTSGIANNINQITRAVNARGFASGEDIAAITAAQETIWNIAERL